MDKRVKAIQLAKNCGQHAALLCGFPVSYTHLDVYKRQERIWEFCLKIVKNQWIMDLGGATWYLPCLFGTFIPVSYTHLDVYKRQVL